MGRSLLPREHGAYGQLGVPLVAALASGRPGVTAVGLAVAAVAAFLASEPARVLAGHRGARARTEQRAHALVRLALLAALAALGASGALAGGTVAIAVGAAALLGAIAVALTAARLDKTLGAASWWSPARWPAPPRRSRSPAASLRRSRPGPGSAGRSASPAVTCAVHATAGRAARTDPRPARWLGGAVILAAGALAIAVPDPLAATAPLLIAAIGLVAVAPTARSLRRIGWVLMIATLAAGAWLVLARLGA
ncbi:MAG: YwiC-like family protein [Kofleriaceae bacterium]|nr:YwiC-like family protein [Kofleriaceae bacterium]